MDNRNPWALNVPIDAFSLTVMVPSPLLRGLMCWQR